MVAPYYLPARFFAFFSAFCLVVSFGLFIFAAFFP